MSSEEVSENTLTEYMGGLETQSTSDEEEAYDYVIDYCDSEALLKKDTYSFQCLQQVPMSDSSLMRNPLFHFPPLDDPGIDEVFNFVEPEPVYGLNGVDKYKDLCKEFNIVPISRIVNCLSNDMLDLKFFCLSEKQIRALSEALTLNQSVKHLNLEENQLGVKAVEYLNSMLEVNETIEYLNMSKCRIGVDGANILNEALLLNNQIYEIDLSFNELGDEGLGHLQRGLTDNIALKTINLSNNHLTERSSEVLFEILRNNNSIENVDLSWNRFSTGPGNKKLFQGFMAHPYMRKLNLAWNGIGTIPSIRPIMKYIMDSTTLEYIDLGNNRIGGGALNMMKKAIMKNESLIEVKLGNNIFTPEEAHFLAKALTQKPRDCSLQIIDMENMCVNKDFLMLANDIQRIGKKVVYGHVLRNFKIFGPDVKKLLFERCKYILMKPKKKKLKKDFGHFVLSLPESNIPVGEFPVLLKKQKIKKLDKDLLTELLKQFTDKRKRVNCVEMKTVYMQYYPDTVLPPKKAKRKRGKGRNKGKKHKKGSQTEKIESEKPKETEPINQIKEKVVENIIDKLEETGGELVENTETLETTENVENEIVFDQEPNLEENKGIGYSTEENIIEIPSEKVLEN